MANEVKFGDWIGKGFEIYKQNLGILIPAGLVAVLLSAVTVGILAGPMMVGLILIVLRLLDGAEPKPAVGDVFKGFSYFANSFLFCLVWGLILFVANLVLAFIPCVGMILSYALSLAVGTLIMFAPFLIAERNMAFWPASMESLNAVKPQVFPLLGLYVVASLIGSVGAILCGIGIVATLPITACILAVAYREYMAPAAAAPQAPVAPQA